jgi:hypothetical protein
MRLTVCGLGRFGLAVLAVAFSACASKPKESVWVPPKMDLTEYKAIGMVEFASNQTGELPRFASERFLAAIQSSQPGVRVIELGPETQVLGAIGHRTLDFQAARAIGAKFGVDAVVTGRLDINEIKPKLNLSNPMAALNVRADAEAALVARVLETQSGATAWTGQAKARAPVAQAGINRLGRAVLSATDPEEAYGGLVDSLVYQTTDDLRGYYVER